MAQLLAPYNNSMRLGQGFNSYTQQICLDQAVLPDTSDNRARLAKSIVLSNKRPTTATAQPSEVTQPLKNGIQSIESNTGPVAENPQKEGHENSLEDPLANTQPTHDGDHTKEGVQDTQKLEVPPWVKPQIVTYSSRFVDKLSDVTGDFWQLFPSYLAMLRCFRCHEHLWFLIHQDSDYRGESQWVLRRQ